jgi:microsomal dipeptidase-like Zn-dependent dipeptidase
MIRGHRVATALALGVAFLLGTVVLVAPAQVEERMNTVVARMPHAPSAHARELHARLFVADMHADTLLWSRDLLVRGTRGHADVPRLIEGNVALQGFTVVTKSPRHLNVHRNDDRSDNITLLAMVERWPLSSWWSLRARALYQAARLREAAGRSEGRLVLIRSRADLQRYAEGRAGHPGVTAGFLGLEGAQALEGELANVDVLYDAGFRMIAPTHFFDTDWAGSAHGLSKGGLTEKGRALVRKLEEKRMLLDLAHASPRTIDDAVAMATRPVLVSHTGVKATCDNERNLSDAQLRGVAATGGVIGIGFWGGPQESAAVCGSDPEAIVQAIRHAVSVAGIDHVGLGSDFDGTVSVPFDASGMAELTDALLRAGFTDEEVAKVMGGNVLRVLEASLP